MSIGRNPCMERLRDHKDLETLIHKYSSKHGRKKIFHEHGKKFLFALFLVLFLPVGSLALIGSSVHGMDLVTGLAVAGAYNTAGTFTEVGGYWHTVRASPDLTKIKLLFYTVWITVVLVGTACMHENSRERMV